MIKYTSKTMDMMDLFLVIRVKLYKKSYFDNYSEEVFCQAIKIF